MKEIQIFRTQDLLELIALLTLVFTIVLVILFRNMEDPSLNKARRGAENLALQLREGGLRLPVLTGASVNRSLASVTAAGAEAVAQKGGVFGPEGQISQDPWGKPFNYKFVKNSGSSKHYLFVWSSGPNAQKETAISGEASLGRLSYQFFRYRGDDIGVVSLIK